MKKAKRLCLTALTWALIAIFISAPSAYAATTIKKGDSGDTVKKIQSRLKSWGYYDGKVDGIFGSGTETAVKKFQKANGLTADGKVGSKTAAAIGVTVGTVTHTSTTAASGDLNLLARCVYGEARGEPYTGMVAVAAVVLNRVDSSKFPNTVSGVIYQKNAFSSVDDGQINMTPSQQAINAAQDAMNGWDPSNGALYFYNPATSTSSWIFSRTVLTVIGRHRFAV